MSKRKLIWRVAEKPTGPYASFRTRGWPIASYNDEILIGLSCKDDYTPNRVKEGNHCPITIRVTDRRDKSNPGWTWRALKQKAKTLDEAKYLAQKFFDENPTFFGLDS